MTKKTPKNIESDHKLDWYNKTFLLEIKSSSHNTTRNINTGSIFSKTCAYATGKNVLIYTTRVITDFVVYKWTYPVIFKLA
jgi:hypothetical protein